MAKWFYPRGSLADGGWETVVDGRIPGWKYTGIRIAELAQGPLMLPANDEERIIVPLSGGAVQAEYVSGVESKAVQLTGRQSVFDGPTDVLYLGRDTQVKLSGSGRVAVASAPAKRAFPACYLSDIPVELRGAGRSSRQVHNFGTPQALQADRLIVCEVITPSDNWSSYPPHKHDEYKAGHESQLEEIYYFEAALSRPIAEVEDSPVPFGLFAAYSSPAGQIDINAIVHTGDVALIPYGYHGPAAAAPGYDLYYLNVMAGPDPDRSWNITDDPAHGWVRAQWEVQDCDSRLPYEFEEE